MIIGVTDTLNEDKYEQYVRWIGTIAPHAELVRVSHAERNADAMDRVHGLLLTGGGDVHPRFYGQSEMLPHMKGVHERRDEFELTVIDRALDRELPILGVCRGMQVVNVALGGTLFVDLPTAGFKTHASEPPSVTMHPVGFIPHSLMHLLAGTTDGTVNSFHHQAVDRLGRGLVHTAVSPDGVAEAAEWAIKDGMSFLLLVQWHPERMPGDLLAQRIAQIFIREVQRFFSYAHEQ